MHKENTKFHKKFRLNNVEFNSVETVLLYAKENETESYPFLTEWFNKKEFVIVKTSGSTGKPKNIKILKEQMINSAIATGNYFDLKEQTTALLCLSPNYIAGKMMLVRALVLGWHLDIVAPKSKPLNGNNKHYDFTAMVPMQLQNSLKNLKNVKQLIVGGGAVSKDLLTKLKPLKTTVFATYGMTETVTHIAVKQLNQSDFDTHFLTLSNINISKDNRGCLVINAPKVSNKSIVTNDLVDIANEYAFKWLGRIDNVINSGGLKIIPEQVEEKLTKIITNAFFISSEKDAILGEKVILIIEGTKVENLKLKIEKSTLLSKFEKPKKIYFIKKFIKTKTEKMDRNKTLKLLVRL